MDYRVDELAQAAGMTSRNVRAYQERGLLPPPRRDGRVAIYDDTHLSRLNLVGSMLARGYTSAHIAEMLTAWEAGKDLGDVLGLEEALHSPWSTDRPVTMPVKQVRALAGDKKNLARLVGLGLVEITGTKAVVARPQLLSTFAEMREFGLPTSVAIDLHEKLQGHIDAIAATLVQTAADNIASLKGARWVPTGNEVGELTTMLTRFRSASTASVHQSLAVSMERTVGEVLGAYLEALSAADDSAGSD